MAVPALTQHIIDQMGSGLVLNYLNENGLNSLPHLYTAAASASTMGCWLESLELLEAAVEKIKNTHDLGNYQQISDKMFDILGNLYSEALTSNPDNTILVSLKNFFKTK